MSSSVVRNGVAACIHLEHKQKAWLDDVSKELHITMSDLVRRLVDERMESGNRDLPQTSRFKDIKLDMSRTHLRPVREVARGARLGRVFLWKCERCGGSKEIPLRTVLSYESRSCGCLGSDMLVKRNKKTHGLSGHKLYDTWAGMCERCSNPTHKSYENYGARGIKVCERWWKFSKFAEDMNPSHRTGLSLDRIDPNGDYEPNNCRWATPRQQQRNRRDNTMLTAFGETKNLYDWVGDPRCVVGLTCLRQRVEKSGWPAERALTKTNLRPHRRFKESA